MTTCVIKAANETARRITEMKNHLHVVSPLIGMGA